MASSVLLLLVIEVLKNRIKKLPLVSLSEASARGRMELELAGQGSKVNLIHTSTKQSTTTQSVSVSECASQVFLEV